MKLYNVNLTREEREELIQFTTTGRHSARKVQNARVLLKADDGLKDERITEHLNVNVRNVERVRKRCSLEGIWAAINPKKRPPKEPIFDGEVEAHLVQLACSKPPNSRQRWTLRLLADKLVELEIVDSISHETVRQRLEKKRVKALAHSKILYPAREKRCVRASNGRRFGGLPASL